ncbi:MAG: ACP S-malonyltransferase, partial [Thermoleophilaceae bacterium]
VAQPALFATSLALDELARQAGVRPAFVAGHSLGEWTAAVAAGALQLEDGMRLVCERGRLMAAAQEERPGSMAALGGLADGDLKKLCEDASADGVVVPANFNSPGQVVISGDSAAVARAMELAREAGGRAMPLRVGAAFHSPLMEDAHARLRELLEDVEVRDAEVPIAANARGALVSGGDEVRAALVEQIVSPVRWVDCVQALAAAGCRHMVELGPGRVLTGLARKIDATLDVTQVDSPDGLAGVAAYVA